MCVYVCVCVCVHACVCLCVGGGSLLNAVGGESFEKCNLTPKLETRV